MSEESAVPGTAPSAIFGPLTPPVLKMTLCSCDLAERAGAAAQETAASACPRYLQDCVTRAGVSGERGSGGEFLLMGPRGI